MSCVDCDEFHDRPASYPYRWGNAVLLVSGCEKHTKEVFDVLSRYQGIMRDKEAGNEPPWFVGPGNSSEDSAVVLGEEARAKSLRSGHVSPISKRGPSDEGGVSGGPTADPIDLPFYNLLASSLEKAVKILDDLIWHTHAITPVGSTVFNSSLRELKVAAHDLKKELGIE